jgi:hypothetical protein
MAFSQFSPGVVIREIDNTTVSTTTIPTYAGIVGPFAKGPVNEVRIISTEQQLEQVFGRPNDNNYEYWFSAAQYLLYGGTIKVVRTGGSTLKNAVSNGTSVKIENNVEYETTYESGSATWYFAAKNPGDYANGVRVYVTDAGADQILYLDAPSSGNEWQFVSGDDIDAATGANGSVFRYTLKVTLNSGVVGSFQPGAATIGGDDCTILAWDADRRILELTLASDYTGIVVAADTVTQSSTGASGVVAASGISRELQVVLAKNSIEFAAGNDIEDNGAATVNIGSVAKEYLTREVFPGFRWSSVGTRPGTSQFTLSRNGYRDEMHVVVVDATGAITGTPNTVLEKFVGLSKATDAKTTNGEINYYKTVLKLKSAYVYVGDHNDAEAFTVGAAAADGNWGQAAANVSFDLAQGTQTTDPVTGSVYIGSKLGPTVQYVLGATSGTAGVSAYSPTNSEFVEALQLFEDPESQALDFIIPGGMGASESEAFARIQAIVNILNGRKDCMAFFSPLRDQVIGVSDTNTITNNLVNWFSKLPSTSYAAFDSGYKYIYDRYNDTFRYIPCNADMAGLCLATQINQDPWFSPAGFQRGVLRNAIRLAYTPNKNQRDQLYVERVNPIVSFPGQGVVLFGDKTALGYQSAFDRINVRRLFLVVEKTVARAAQNVLFQQNDDTSRSGFLNAVEPYLRNIQGRRGLIDFLVKCDTSNNPPDAIDRGEFYAEIYLKPTRTINYISISFIATRTGVAFEEVAS